MKNCILPNEEFQKFLIEVINQTNFPGKHAEFVAHVKSTLENAEIISSQKE